MFRHICKILCVIFLTLATGLFPQDLFASHSMGADLTYECIGPNTYKIRLSFYRDCYGVSEPTIATINVSSASCGQNFNIIAYKIPGTGQEITPVCPTVTTTCNGGSYTGVEEWIYEGTVVLPMQCTDWVFSFSLCCRNTAITTINNPGNNDFYIYATLNNTISPCNNSPTFSNKPVPFVCIGQQFCFNHGAFDADGDSLVYSLIDPLQTAAVAVNYNAPYSATQPVISSPGMQFSTSNGNICMTPQQLEITVMAVLVQEYRNGVLIGSVERDIQLTIINCSNSLPTLSGINGSAAITDTICANEPYCFDVYSVDNDPGQNLTINYDQSIPGATFSNNGAQPPTGTFCWTPTTAQISPTPHCFTITVKDDACPYYGYQVYSYCLTVTGVNANAGPDQYLGCNLTTSVSASGSGGNPPYTYLWSTGSSDQTISVGPGTYVVTVSDGLCSNQDTVVVTNAPLPTVSAVPVPVNCTSGNDGSITANVSGGTMPYQYSIDNGVTYQPAATFNNLPAGNYNIIIQDANGCTATTTAQITEPPALTVAPSSVNSTCSNSNGSISIIAGGGTGTIEYSIDNGITYQSSSSFSNLVAGSYDIMIRDANGCTATSNIAVTDEPSPVIDATPVVNVSCNTGNDGTITINASGGTGAVQYSINNGTTYQSSSVFNTLTAGNFNIIIQDANGCTATTTAQITEPPALTVTPSSVNSTCSNSNGSITIIAGGGTGTFEYSIDNGTTYQLSSSFSNLAAGNYDIMIRDANGCTAISSIVVPDEPSPTIDATPVVNVSCNTGNDGSITINASGGTGAVQYSIDNGSTYQSSSVFNTLTAGNYYIIIQDANGCTATTTVQITEPPALSVSPSSVNSTCSNNNGSISIIAGGGIGIIEYSIDNGITYQLSSSFGNLAAGNYDIMIRDANGCTAASNVIVPDEPSPVIDATPVVNVSCYTGNDGTITINASGGTGAIQYSIDNGTTYQSSSVFNTLTVGIYNVIIQDANGCTATTTAQITEPPVLTLSLSSVNSTCSNSNGSVSIIAGGGTGAIEYSIDNGTTYQSLSSFSNLAAGSYDIMIRDANGCTATSNIAVPDEPSPVIDATPVVNVSCNTGNDGTITINTSGGTGAVQYSIDNGTTYQSSSVFNTLTAGNYNIIIQDANGCTTTAIATVTEPTPIVVNVNTIAATCGSSNGTLNISANGGTGILEYSIDSGLTMNSGGTFNNLAAGNYDIIVQDQNGCQSPAVGSVSNALSPVINSTNVNDVVCFNESNGTITINAGGGTGILQYSSDNGLNYQTGNTFSNLPAGVYNIVVQDDNGCITTTAVTVDQPDAVTFVSQPVTSTCSNNNGSLSINANGGSGTYQYSINSGTSYYPTNVFNNLSSGNYSIVVTDINGCTGSGNVVVPDAPSPVLTAITGVNLTCFGSNDGSIVINATGGSGLLVYSIDGGTTNDSSNNYSGLSIGNYNILVTDTNGCTADSAVTLTQPALISFNANTSDASCGNSDGTLAVNASGGTGLLQFSIDSGLSFQSTGNFINLLAGTYEVVVMDDNGCTSNQQITVNNAAAPAISSLQVTNLTCHLQNNGTIIINASGGTGTLTYSINNGNSFSNSNTFNNLAAGTYNVVVQDINGCEASSTLTISQPDPVSYIANPTTATCSNNNGVIEITANGGTGAYQFSINGGTTFQPNGIFNNLPDGSYSILVHDVNGCTASGSINVSNAPAPVIDNISLTNLTCYNSGDGAVSITSAGGTGAIQYSIDAGLTYQSSGNFNSLSSGQYSITIIDDNGCTNDSLVTLSQPDEIIASATTVQSTCGNSNGSVSVSVSGGTGTYQYSIDSGATYQANNQFSGLLAGAYGIIIQDGAGCLSNLPVAISNAAAPSITAVDAADASCYGESDGYIDISASGGTGSLQYSINNGITYFSTGQFLNLQAGNYSILVIDANGCLASSSEVITEPDQIIVGTSSVSSTCGTADGSVTISASGGTGILEYSIDSGSTYFSNSFFPGLSAGNYSVIVQDSTGCSAGVIASVNNLNGPVITNTDVTDLNCFGSDNGTINIATTGGTGTLNYSIDNGISFQAIGSYSNLPGGTYSIVVTDSNSCIATTNVVIAEPPLLTITPVIDDATCGFSNGVITIYATGGTGSLLYSIDSGTTFQSGSSFMNLMAAGYDLVVVDSNGCSTSTAIVVNDQAGPVIASSSFNDVSCFGGDNGSISLQITGGTSPISYQWSNTVTTQNTSGLQAGNYSVIVTDANSCLTSQSFLISEPPLLMGNAVPVHVSCYAGINGSMHVMVAGGTAPYTYLWSDGTTGTGISGLSVGNYSVTVTDSLGCFIEIADSITSPAIIAIGSTTTDVTCYGSNDGAVQTAVNGGVSPYTYLWSNGVTAPSISNLSGGLYKVTVTDNNNCIRQKVLSVDEPDPLVLTTYGSDTICIGQSVIISAVAGGGIAPYTYVWSNGVLSNTQSVNPVTSTVYLAGVTDANGCTVTPESVPVYVNPPLSVIVTPDNEICEGESTIISAVVTGGNGGPYSYAWNLNFGNVSSIQVSPDSTSIYSVSVSDNCGTPVAVSQTSVIVHPRPQVAFIPNPPKGCVPLEVSFQNSTVTEPGSDYYWNFGDGNTDSVNVYPSHVYYEPGIYSIELTVTSPFGCSRSLTLYDAVQVYSLPVADFRANPPRTTILDPRIEFIDLSTDASYWSWDFGDYNGTSSYQNPVYTYRDTGTYEITLYIENIYGCADTAYGEVIIEGDYTLYIPNAFTPNGDGINEIFTPQGIGITDLDFMIFNRWGQKVFQSNSIAQGWNGKSIIDNSNCAQGVYVYVVKAVDLDGNGHEYSGRVTLVR